MADAYLDIIPGTGQILGQDLEATIIESLHKNAPLLVDALVPLIQARTPLDTGALQLDITGTPYATGRDLALLWEDSENQEDVWGRVYAPYQEGPDLGLPTYTNAPHLMYASVLTDDIPVIQQWGNDCCQEALNQCATGRGVLA